MRLPGPLQILTLPTIPYIDKKRSALSFLLHALLSTFRKKARSLPLGNSHAKTDSEKWDRYRQYLDLYVRYLAPRYLLSSHIVRFVAGGYAHHNFAPGGRSAPTAETVATLPEDSREAIGKVSAALAKRFPVVERQTAFNWLSRYQLAPLELGFPAEEISELFRNNLIVELGPGIGANAMVNACLSQKGVLAFDLPEMRVVQEAVFEEVAGDLPSLTVNFVSDLEELLQACSKREYVLVSFWAFTEFPIELRKRVEPLIENARLSLFACNKEFEGINNM